MTDVLFRMPGGRRGRRLVGVAAVLMTLVSLAAVVVMRVTALPADVALRAGGTDVTRAELDRRVQMLGSLYGVKPPPDPRQGDTFRRETARAVAVSTVLDHAAAQRGIVVDDRTAQGAEDAMIQQRMGPQGRPAFVQLLGEAGASEGDVLEEVRRQQATMRLFDQVAAPSANLVTPADVEAWYRTHPSETVFPEQRHVRNIVLATQPAADDVVRRLAAGEDFAAVARDASQDDSTRETGGDLGLLGREQLEPAFASAVFGAAPGPVVGPVQTRHGFDVAQVLEVRPPVQLTLDQMRAGLTDRLRSERTIAAWNAWTADAVRDADVEYADDLRPADPPAGPPVPAVAPTATTTRLGPDALPPPAGTPGGGGGSVSSPPLTAAAMIITGIALVGVGVWGRRNLDDLVPAALDPQRRARKRRSLRRGVVMSFVSGGALIALALVGVVVQLT